MNWWKFGVLAWFAISVLFTISAIGKPRKPLEPSAVVGVVLVTAVIAFCVVQS